MQKRIFLPTGALENCIIDLKMKLISTYLENYITSFNPISTKLA